MKPTFAKRPTTPPPHRPRNLRPRPPPATSARTIHASHAAQPQPQPRNAHAHAADDAAHRRRRFPPNQTAPPDARPLRPIVVGRSTTDGNDGRRKRRQTETAAPPPPGPAEATRAQRGQRPEQAWNERIGGSLWSFSLSKARTALERTLEPDVQNRRAVGRAHGLRNRQILAVAIPDALPGKQEGVGRKQVVDHV